ncbi:MAG: cupin domain-containing protein [Anaeromyxobacter sp.]|nr:cupin domain-containing protein [Anaeromyxobacter sp.]MBL0277778.1 cupin domain-containing protein [Anaeromyxobacter sp.]
MSTFDQPKRVEKPWGYELWWAQSEKYVGKLLHVKAGFQLSLQYHVQKDETIHLASGQMVLVLQQDGRLVDHPWQPGQSFRVRPGTIHRMRAVTDCDVWEVSTPEVEDVVRVQDDYGR